MDFQFTGPVQIRDSAPFITNHTLALKKLLMPLGTIKVWFVCAHMCLFSAYMHEKPHLTLYSGWGYFTGWSR